jgi:hypothetical protein
MHSLWQTLLRVVGPSRGRLDMWFLGNLTMSLGLKPGYDAHFLNFLNFCIFVCGAIYDYF